MLPLFPLFLFLEDVGKIGHGRRNADVAEEVVVTLSFGGDATFAPPPAPALVVTDETRQAPL